jgi:acyl-coenzyme A thioesterase PaaI-like protein
MIRSHKAVLALKRSLSTFNVGDEVRDPKVIRYSFEKASPYIRNVIQPQIIDMRVGYMKMLLKYRKRFHGTIMVPGCTDPTDCIQNGIVATMMDHTTGACAWTCLSSPELFVNTVGK